MKQLKKIPSRLKDQMSEKGLVIKNWGLKSEDQDKWIIQSRNSTMTKVFYKR